MSLTKKEQEFEWLKCERSPLYFIHNYCMIQDAKGREWIEFKLWPEQAMVVKTINTVDLVIVLKARQLGLTWLVLCYFLWLMLFQSEATVLLFSRRDDEAIHLLDFRLKGIYKRLPDFMKSKNVLKSNKHEWILSNGSVARAFPATGGDSYTATAALIDEADLVPNLGRMLNSVKPTIDGGGKLILLSRSDKSSPASEFKNIYRAAKKGVSPYKDIFLPWNVRPSRDADWYALQKQDSLSRTQSLDSLHEQYPATDIEALAPRQLDKRIPLAWLEDCYIEAATFDPRQCPAIPGLDVYALPNPGERYGLGADPAEGNPTSDDSAATVLSVLTGEEVAKLQGKFQPSVFASYIDTLGSWYNDALILPERNNHGHAVLLWLEEFSHLQVGDGFDRRPGWNTTTRGKALMYSDLADAFKSGETIIHSFDSFSQISSIEGATLSAPDGQMDDLSDSYALAIQSIKQNVGALTFIY